MKRSRIHLILITLMLVCAIAIRLTGCAAQVQAVDLMKGIEAASVAEKTADSSFIRSQTELSVKLFQASAIASKEQNVLISPLSIQLALAMTANGADGQTRAEMEKLLGGDIPLSDLNEYLYSYVNTLPSEKQYKLEIANSIWFRDGLDVENDFLQTNASYYGAQAYRSPFDAQACKDINSWVDQHTDGMIDHIINSIAPDDIMYLINALAFDAKWEKAYEKSDIHNDIFTSISGEERNVEMMHSEESKYLNDGKATGFIKDYKDGKYSFAALLPNEGVDIYDYISALTAESLSTTLQNAQSGVVITKMPKFSAEYALSMKDVLAELGMPTAFNSSEANFSKMASSVSGNIYIGDVLHKTFISVDERGTKAGAVTMVGMKNAGLPSYDWVVHLNRPFVYMIIDNNANLPIFIGAVTDIQG